MVSLIPSESVTFFLNEGVESDSLGNELPVFREVVVDCVIDPGTSIDRDGAYRLVDESKIVIHAHESFTDSVKNAELELRGRRYRVLGDPIAFTASPLPWNRAISAEVVE